MVAVLFIVFVVALAIGVPVAFSLGLASVAYMLGSHIQMINFAQYFSRVWTPSPCCASPVLPLPAT